MTRTVNAVAPTLGSAWFPQRGEAYVRVVDVPECELASPGMVHYRIATPEGALCGIVDQCSLATWRAWVRRTLARESTP